MNIFFSISFPECCNLRDSFIHSGQMCWYFGKLDRKFTSENQRKPNKTNFVEILNLDRNHAHVFSEHSQAFVKAKVMTEEICPQITSGLDTSEVMEHDMLHVSNSNNFAKRGIIPVNKLICLNMHLT